MEEVFHQGAVGTGSNGALNFNGIGVFSYVDGIVTHGAISPNIAH